ncbi:hypothetical protein FBZ89_14218 [Nitrospirillum amazonense]|uniref:Uncharacterized protein n=1 Tax=Nitrospirillum amazonense TaxID=28077 RepID=A0A560EIY8_9PROT|nr:hypothetical protein [Nitrospirillum amazonense]TWB09334.1 hypothetical protein FBZ89_14218 [Nitrospirillum amazonense]
MPTISWGRLLASSVAVIGAIFPNYSTSQEIPQAIPRSCNGFNMISYRYHAICYRNVPDSDIAIGNSFLNEGVNYWSGYIDKVMCAKPYTISPKDRSKINDYVSTISRMDEQNLDAMANCNISLIEKYAIDVKYYIGKIDRILQCANPMTYEGNSGILDQLTDTSGTLGDMGETYGQPLLKSTGKIYDIKRKIDIIDNITDGDYAEAAGKTLGDIASIFVASPFAAAAIAECTTGVGCLGSFATFSAGVYVGDKLGLGFGCFVEDSINWRNDHPNYRYKGQRS